MTKQECLDKVSQAIRDAYKHVESRQTKMNELVTPNEVLGQESKVGDSSTHTSDSTTKILPQKGSTSRYAKRPRSLTERDDESTAVFPGLIDQSTDIVNIGDKSDFHFPPSRLNTSPNTSQQFATARHSYSLDFPSTESQHLVEEISSKLPPAESYDSASFPSSSSSNKDRNNLMENDDGRIFNLEQMISRFDAASRSGAAVSHKNSNSKLRHSDSVESDCASDFDSFVQTIEEVLGPLQPEDFEFAFSLY